MKGISHISTVININVVGTVKNITERMIHRRNWKTAFRSALMLDSVSNKFVGFEAQPLRGKFV